MRAKALKLVALAYAQVEAGNYAQAIRLMRKAEIELETVALRQFVDVLEEGK